MRRPVKWIVGAIVVLGLAHPLPIGVIGQEFREDEWLAIVEYLIDSSRSSQVLRRTINLRSAD